MRLTRFHREGNFHEGMFRVPWMRLDQVISVIEDVYNQMWAWFRDELPIPPRESLGKGLCAWTPKGLARFEHGIRFMASLREAPVVASTVNYDEVEILYEDPYQVVFKCRESETSSGSRNVESSTR